MNFTVFFCQLENRIMMYSQWRFV